MKKFRRYMSIAVLIVVAVGAVLLLTPIGERPLAAVFAVGDVETVDFAAPALSDKPNWFLMCPPDLCGAGPHADSPLFDVPVERLRARWREVATAEPGDDILAEHGDGWQFDYVQRSARFPYAVTGPPHSPCFSSHSRARRWASAICVGVIFLATMSRFLRPFSLPFDAAKFHHMCA